MEDPWALLWRLKLGREEYCQRLLTMLILGGAYPRWNTRSAMSVQGIHFVNELEKLSFGTSEVTERAKFVDELELPARHDDERGGAPDYAVLTSDRVWLIELKTEAASHRKDQLPYYLELAHHHYPGLRVELTYLTPPLPGKEIDLPGARFAHLTWDDVLPLLDRPWDGGKEMAGRIIEALKQALAGIGSPWTEWRGARTEDAVASAVELAALTEGDGTQRALDFPFESLEELQEARIAVRDELVVGGSRTQPWVWRASTSGGQPLTATGRATGYELRMSRSRTPAGGGAR